MSSPQPIKLLIVDDPETLVALPALLRRDDLELLVAHAAEEALDLVRDHDVALALIDLQTPGIDGFALAEQMHGMERARQVPIIFLDKPIEPHVLTSKIDVVVELAKQKAQLAHVLHINETFMAILGHDLRNPLGAMLVGVEVLAEGATTELQRNTLRRMQSAGRRMSTMIEQLLDLTRARLDGGLANPAKRAPIDVGALVHRAIDELRDAHPGREVALECHGACMANGEADRLLQMFANLIGNAVAHATKGTRVTVTVASTADDVVEVAIANAGTIAPELLPEIFEPFRGRGSRTTASAGLGLGMFISHEIASAHGGDIAVTSTEADGTRVVVRLPQLVGATELAAVAS